MKTRFAEATTITDYKPTYRYLFEACAFAILSVGKLE